MCNGIVVISKLKKEMNPKVGKMELKPKRIILIPDPIPQIVKELFCDLYIFDCGNIIVVLKHNTKKMKISFSYQFLLE